jgi:hypothetical protein
MSAARSARAVALYLKNRAAAAVGRDPYEMDRSVPVLRGAATTWKICRAAGEFTPRPKGK